VVKLRITLHIRYVATFSRKTQPVRALSLISQADGYAKGIPPRLYISYQGTHLGLIDGLRSVLPSPLLTAVYLEPDGSPIETSIMSGYHGTVLRTSYARCEMLYGLNLPYPGEWVGEWADKTNSQNIRVDSAGLPNVITLAECGDDSAGQEVRSVALSSRLLVVPPSASNDRMIPSKVPLACSILEHQTDDRKFIKHYDYHCLRGKSSNLKLGSESTSPTADMGTTLLESRERQGTSRVLLERVETNVNFPEPCPLGVGLRRLPRAPLSCSH
jgi:hypothetical protein